MTHNEISNKSTNRFTFSVSAMALVAGLLMTAPAYAVDENNVAPGLTAVGAPLGLHGVDPVASIDVGSPIEGIATFASIYEGVAYYFTSSENLKAFKANPSRYVPQNGGFCTYGVSVGKKFDGDPTFSSVIDGKLYVFLNEEIYKIYLKDQASTIKKAAAQWKKIEHLSSTSL